MTDELNLVPTNNLEKHLDNILRAASGEEPQYDLAPNWRVEQYLAAIAAKLSKGGSADNRFIVTLTPTSEDFSGTMDHTVGEMKEALDSGKDLWYAIGDNNGTYYMRISEVYSNNDDAYPSFNATAWLGSTYGLLQVFTASTDDPDRDTYGVDVIYTGNAGE
jgi:hypothetical protein